MQRLAVKSAECERAFTPRHHAPTDGPQSFGIAGAAFVATECSIEKWRARHDVFNAVFAGITAGAAMGAWNARAAAAPGEAPSSPKGKQAPATNCFEARPAVAPVPRVWERATARRRRGVCLLAAMGDS